MAFSTYLYIMMGISIAFWFFGYPPAAYSLLTQSGINIETGEAVPIADTMINGIRNLFSDPLFLAAIGIPLVLSVFIGGSGGQSVYFVIPLLMLTVFMNIFIFPTSFIFNQDMPVILRAIFNLFLNSMLMMSIIEFIRGGNI